MPFKSKSQQRWMFATNPEMARRWAHETDDIKGLPDKVRKAKKKRKKAAADATAELREAGQSISEPRGGRGEYAAESGEELQRFATLLGFSDKRASLSMGSGAHEGSLMDIYEASGAGGRVLSSPLTPAQASGTCMHGGSGMDLSALVKAAYGMMQQNPQNASGPSPPASGVVNPISATGYAQSPEMTEMWRQQMLNMSGGGQAPPMRGMQLGAQPLHGTADTLGSPIATGKLGNGPGVGFSGAGTQMNFGGVAEKMAGGVVAGCVGPAQREKHAHYRNTYACGHVEQCRCRGPKEQRELGQVCPECLEKAAAWQDDLLQFYKDNPAAVTGTAGAIGGAGLGAMMAPKGKRLQRAALGGLVGGGAGAAGGYGVSQIPGALSDGMRDRLLGAAAGLGAMGGGVLPNTDTLMEDEEEIPIWEQVAGRVGGIKESAATPLANPQLAKYLGDMYDQAPERETSTGHMDELDQIELLMELEAMTGKNVPDDAAFLKHKMPPWYKPWGQREWERFPNYGAIDDYMTSLQQPQKAAAEDSHSDPLASVAGGGYRDVLTEHVTQDQTLQAGRKLCKSGGATPKRKVIRVVDAKLAAANDLRAGKPQGTHGEALLLCASTKPALVRTGEHHSADRVSDDSLLKAAFNLGMARLDHGGGTSPLKPAQPAQPPKAAGPQSPAKPMTPAKPQAPSAGPVPRPIDSLPFELRTSSPVSDEERYYKSLMRYKEQLQAPKAQLAGPGGSPSLK